ncbi:MAG: hypothetical protein WA913_08450 [Pricia sp.]
MSTKTKHIPKNSKAHYQHYYEEFSRIKKLAEKANGEDAENLYHELDGITMILEDYLP